MLSGGARIHSRHFRDELVSLIPAPGDEIIGGEMEGVGLLSVSPLEDPAWIIVKGISDFADEDRDAVITESRPIACRNAADFVLRALLNAHHD
jgi:adenosylhomocysteine nucleosidase